MKRRIRIAAASLMVAAGLTTAVAAPAALAAPPEPGFSKSTAIEADLGTNEIDSRNAPLSINQGCGSTTNNHAVWFTFTPETNATITANTIGSVEYTDPSFNAVDTVLAVSQGKGKKIACEDDGLLENNWSQVTFEAQAGTTYYISVASYAVEAGGDIDLNLSAVGAA